MKPFSFLLAMFCVIVCFSACSPSETGVKSVESDIIKVSDSWSPLTSLSLDGLSVDFASDKETMAFIIHACDGSFSISKSDGIQHVSDITLSSGEAAYWTYYPVKETDSPWYGTTTFLEVLIMEGEHYVGYGVVRIGRPDDIYTYSATVIECKEFPKIKGDYQKIPLELIDQMIETAKHNA